MIGNYEVHWMEEYDNDDLGTETHAKWNRFSDEKEAIAKYEEMLKKTNQCNDVTIWEVRLVKVVKSYF